MHIKNIQTLAKKCVRKLKPTAGCTNVTDDRQTDHVTEKCATI